METMVQQISHNLLPVLFSGFWSILFLQSGLDKLLDWSGNLQWLKGHFSKSLFANAVPLLLAILTLTELTSGIVSLTGAFYFLGYNSLILCQIGTLLASVSILMLFLGQRIAKDYPGAASLTPYFLAAMFNLWLLNM
jgi:putative oxidoreductase